jgi:DNA polymerase
MLSKLYLDFETRSELDLTVCGLDNYVKHPSTRVLMLAYTLDDGPVLMWEPHMGPMPSQLRGDLEDVTITKVAWNVPFEYNVFRHVLKIDLPLWMWSDPVNQARMLSMPGHLKDACEILNLPPELSKDPEGKRLIKIFSMPAVAKKDDTLFGTIAPFFRDWLTDPEDWEKFKGYCIRDVVAEREIDKLLAKFPLPEAEYQAWLLDQQINERGLPVDMGLVKGTTAVAEAEKERLREELQNLTGLENSNSVQQLLAWAQQENYPFGSLAKHLVQRALAGEGNITPAAHRALTLRGQTAKTSDTKLDRIAEAVSSDGRLRNQYVFLGAAKTGRWASYHVQLANLPRPTKEVEKNLDRAIELLRAEDQLNLAFEFPNTLEVVSSVIRSMFKAPRGSRFLVGDLNAIENRMIGWLAQCAAILNVFRDNRDPYLDFAAVLFNRDYGELYSLYKAGDPKVKEIRQQVKPAVLGCGYRLSGGEEVENPDGDLIKTGLWGYAASMHITITQDFAISAVKLWRERYKEVVSFWYALEEAARVAVFAKEPQRVGFIEFVCKSDKLLSIKLPSGRSLHYIRPRYEIVDFKGNEKETLTYEGVDAKTKQWTRLRTHGGKLLENLSQAISRDILLHGITLAAKQGFEIVGHVHDEIISEVAYDAPQTLDQLLACMATTPDWAPGLPLGADGFESEVYKKG